MKSVNHSLEILATSSVTHTLFTDLFCFSLDQLVFLVQTQPVILKHVVKALVDLLVVLLVHLPVLFPEALTGILRFLFAFAVCAQERAKSQSEHGVMERASTSHSVSKPGNRGDLEQSCSRGRDISFLMFVKLLRRRLFSWLLAGHLVCLFDRSL